LVNDRLREYGFSTMVLSDEDLGRDDTVVRVRSLEFGDTSLLLRHGGNNATDISWPEFTLMVSGRLVVQKVEVNERVSRGPETEILDTSEFFSEEPVFDIYSTTQDQTWRFGTTTLDFSCLQDQKSFIAEENHKKLQELIVERCPKLQHDSSYNAVRNILKD